MSNFSSLFPFYIVGFIGFASFSLLLPVLPFYALEQGASVPQVGLIVAAYSYVIVLTLTPFGLLSDRVGYRKPLVVGLALFTLAPLLYLLARTPEWLILVRVFHGLVTAIFFPLVMARVASLAAPERRGEALGWFTASTQLGFTIGPLFGGLLLKFYNFNVVFCTCSIISLVGLVFILFNLALIPQGVAVSTQSNSWSWLKQRRAFGSLLTPFFIGIGSGTIVTFVPPYARAFTIDEVRIGLIITVLYATSTLVRVPAGRLSDRIGRKPIILLGLGLGALALALFSLSHSLSWLLPSAILFGLGMGLAMPASFASVTDLTSSGVRGAAMGVTESFLPAGIAIGATIMGFIAGAYSFGVMFFASALSLSLGFFLVLGLIGKQS